MNPHAKALGKLPEERFWFHVNKTPTCWLWIGWKSHNGYGRFSINASKKVQAHRFAYELLRGPIPAGLQIDHLCRVPACVNPAHMEVVTASVNQKRGTAGAILGRLHSSRTHCPR